MDSSLLSVFILLSISYTAHGYPDGAQVGQCDNMTPSGHNAAVQPDPSPYTISAGSMDYYTAGSPITVTISGGTSDNLKGFLLQARQENTATIVDGTFTTFDMTNYETLGCSGTANALTHSNNNVKDTTNGISFTYTAPNDCNDGNIEFVATIVQERVVYWMGVKSSSLSCMAGNDNTTSYVSTVSGEKTTSKGTSNVPALFTMLSAVVALLYFRS